MEKLQSEIRGFVGERQWQRYHSPKNLAMALSVEIAELVEIFQWLSPAQSSHPSPETQAHIAEEIGDIMIYLTMIADQFGLDPITAASNKLVGNRRKYPAEPPAPDDESGMLP